MSPILTALIGLQRLDTAADAIRRRLSEMPAAERDADAHIAAATAGVEAAKAELARNQHERRELEKQVAQVDTRLARFDDHKAAVKTNQEFTALLHEITVAKGEKDAIEEKILLLLEAADGISVAIKSAERVLADATREGDAMRKALAVERTTLAADLDALSADRARDSASLDRAILAKYDQLLKQRRMIAVAPIDGELCTACHVRLRPAVAQQIRRNENIVQCDSCQRILYAPPPKDAA
jgi:predicted  nucleic acid-binding Zn-ribbon protein